MSGEVDGTGQERYTVPSHVPLELVHPFDFVHAPGIEQQPFATVEQYRHCGRVFWNPINPFFGGAWVLTRAEDLRYVLSNPKLFSNVGEAEHSRSEDAEVELIPLEYDPPEHTRIRHLLNPILSPPAVHKLGEGIRAHASALIDVLVPQGKCEFVDSFAVPLPVSVFLQLMGLPQGDAPMALGWKSAILHVGEHVTDNAVADAASHAVIAYLDGHAAARRANPREDFISHVANAQVAGQRLQDREVRGILYLMLLAGLDTVTATLGWFFHHLAAHPDQQAQLRADPSLVPQAVEEMMRLYSITVAHRKCLQDVEVAGVAMKKGDWISICAPFGSMDPEEFPDPDRYNLARGLVRHFGFGFGPHICAGAHLARLELTIALEEWLARVPPWRFARGPEMNAYTGTSFGLHNLHLAWDA